MQRKGYAFIVCFIFAFTPLFAASPAPDIARIQKQGYIKVAVYGGDDEPFIIHHKDGSLSGFDIDLANDLAKHLGVKAKFIIAGKYYDDVINSVADHRADLGLSQLSRTLKRTEKVDFSTPYLKVQLFLLVNRLTANDNEHKLALVDALSTPGHTLAILKQSGTLEYALDFFPGIHIKEYDDINALALAVKNNQVSAALIDSVDLENLYYDYPQYNIYVNALIYNRQVDTSGIAINQKDTTLLHITNLYLEQAASGGFLTHLHHVYLEDAAWRTAR